MPAIDLIQPRHNYAPPPEQEKLGHVYMPTSLFTVGARLLEAGVEVRFHDENIRPREITTRFIGSNLLGAPYIPEVMRLQRDIANDMDGSPTFFLGGQVASGLSAEQIKRLFGDATFNGNDDTALATQLGIDERSLVVPEHTSLVPAYEQLRDADMREYLSTEFPLYVSQGCKFACDFCAAVRTFKDPSTGTTVKVKEAYRDPAIIERDLEYLMTKARSFGLKKMDAYMSNLDVFQTPHELFRFAQAVKAARSRNPEVGLTLRGLATVDSYLSARNTNPGAIEALVEAGFDTVGFGVDGMTPEVWSAVKKGHNTEDKCLEAIRSVKEDYGMTPEILMVFGHEGVDTKKTLALAYEFTVDMVEMFGAVPRPHVAKAFVPGNDGWRSERYASQVEVLMSDPDLFQSLDFTALPSVLTHPDEELRILATQYFLEICAIKGNTTKSIVPMSPGMSPADKLEAKSVNLGQYDR